MSECLLKFDSFLQPYVSRGTEAIATLLVRLILLDPGTIPSEPDCGVGLLRNWRFCSERDFPKLEEEIKKQKEKYLPELSFIDVTVSYNPDKEMIINMTIENAIYPLRVNPNFDGVRLGEIIRIK